MHGVTLDTARLDGILAPVVAWARCRSDIVGVALAGSWVRGAARDDSDIDLILLVADPRIFRRDDWLAEIQWHEARPAQWRDADYGVVWSRHVRLIPPCEIELTFCSPSWAGTDPVDAGTAKVISDGCQVLLDKSGLFKKLLSVCSP
jgi:hypothetical protein